MTKCDKPFRHLCFEAELADVPLTYLDQAWDALHAVPTDDFHEGEQAAYDATREALRTAILVRRRTIKANVRQELDETYE